MRGPFSLEDFARLARVPAEEISACRDAGLLDPDKDGLLDDFDVLRMAYIQIYQDEGKTLDEIARGIADGTIEIPFFGDVLFGRGHLFRRDWPSYTPEEAAERIGLTVEQLEALRTASGLPGTGMEQADVDMLAGVKAVVDSGMPWEAIVEVTRVYGDSLRRIAEAEMRMMHEHVHEGLAATGMTGREIARQAHPLVEAMTSVVDPTIQYLHHQHLLRRVMDDVLDHLQSPGRSHRGSFEATILFVDLTSYTSLAQVHGDEVAAEVLDRFDGLVRSLVHRYRGTLVKQIGDAFMLTFNDPADAVRFAIALEESAAHEEHFPALRVGIHAGPVLYRVGDYVGNTVNIASRIAAAAMPNQIVLTEPVAKAAEAAGLSVASAGVRELRGVKEPLGLFLVVRQREIPTMDPVCGMKVLSDAAARLTWAGVEYVFCSEDCLKRFVEEPGRYAAAAAAKRES